MEGGSGGLGPLLNIIKDFGGADSPSSNMLMLGKFLTMYLSKGGSKGKLLTIEEEWYNPVLAFYLYFHIRCSNKNSSFMNAKMGVVEGVVDMFPTTQPPFSTTPLSLTYQ